MSCNMPITIGSMTSFEHLNIKQKAYGNQKCTSHGK